MPYFDLQTGEEVHAFGDEAQQLLAQGKIGVPKGTRVDLVSPDGRFGSIPAESLAGALSRGFRPPSIEEAQKRSDIREVSNPADYAKTFGEGALRAISLGASDAILAGGEKRAPSGKVIGDDERDQRRRKMRLRKEYNPKSEFAGEAAGIAASMGIDAPVTGPGLAVRAGEAAEGLARGAELARVFKGGVQVASKFERPLLGTVAKGVTEGTLYGLGAGVSEAALTDQPDVAGEKILAGTIGGALSGGALSAAGYGAGKAGEMLAGALGSQTLKEHLTQSAETMAVRQFAQKTDLKKYGLKDRITGESGVGRYMLDKLGMTAGDTAETLNAKATTAVQQLEGQLASTLADVDMKAASNRFDISKVTARVQQDVLDKMTGPGISAERNTVKKWLRELQAYAPGGPQSGQATFSDVYAWQRQLGEAVSPGGASKLQTGNLQEFRKILLGEIESQADGVSPHFGKQIQALRREQANALEARRITGETITRNQGNTPGGLLGNIWGAAAAVEGVQHFGPAGAILGPAAGFAQSQVRKRAGTIAAVALDKLAQSGAPEMLAKGFQKFVDASLASNPMAFGTFRGIIETAAARGAQALLATHTQLARTNPDYLAQAGLQAEDPQTAGMYTDKLHGISQLQQAVDMHDAQVDMAISRFVGSQGGRAPKSEAPDIDQADYKQRFDRLVQLVHDPEALAQALNVGDLHSVAPEVAGHMTMQGANAVQFLYSMAPKPPTPGAVPALDQAWEPSWTELQRWGRYVDAVERPAKAIDQLRNGTMSKEAIDTLRAVYPGMLQDIQKRMMERLAEYKKPLDPARKAALSMLFGSPMGGMGDPARIALMQAMHHASMSAESKPMSGGDGRQKVSGPENEQTQSQRLEARNT